MCVPVTVLGTPMGVLHTVGAEGELPSATERVAVEAVAEQAGSRIGVLRAMAASELQATTDPLTGLLNRRSLEAELCRAARTATPSSRSRSSTWTTSRSSTTPTATRPATGRCAPSRDCCDERCATTT